MATQIWGSRATAMEADARNEAKYPDIESSLSSAFSGQGMSYIDRATSLLGSNNPFKRKADPEHNEIWLFDNTAYRPVNASNGQLGPWQAEFVAAFFIKGRADINSAVAKLIDTIGLDGEIGSDPKVHQTIEERLEPFVQAIAPARTLDITIPPPDGSPFTRTLGPSDGNGISSQILLTGGRDTANGKTATCTAAKFPTVRNSLQFVGPDGWTIISDIDDTIKSTMTPDPLGVLKSTFVDAPKVVNGMPQLYTKIDSLFHQPAWFYLSASPYNLYPFLHTFLSQHYAPGTIILRDASWMFFAGLLQSLTQGVQAYKTDRLEKIHSWIPRRKVICIGDSTQSDPESYADVYRKHPEWIKAIYIRKVTDAPFMERKNRDERFEEAFKDVPRSVWRVFVEPEELEEGVQQLAASG
jgi:hypothetical protein